MSLIIHHLSLQDPLGERTLTSNPLPVPNEHERNHSQSHRNKCQQGSGPIDPKLPIHRVGGQWQTNRESGPHGAGCSLGGSRVLLIGVGQVVDHGHEDEDVPHSKPETRHNRHDGMDGQFCGPSEPEQSNW